MREKGYNPVNRSWVTLCLETRLTSPSHNGARSMIMKVERDELVEELLKDYIKNNAQQ